ncbi:MAG: DUF3604 domain-containing protein [Deltaproteobacteria bacterium]|nr:MAG: DUF3604 domain-containing protein [Deltaproteobacteria bacterium]
MRRARRAACCALVPLWLLGAGAAGAFERTEARAPCADHAPLRKPHFGDLHVHTTRSFDANALGVRTTPRDAYRFARGERLGLQPFDGSGTARRSAKLERPLDFAAVTDHAELLGEVRICETRGAPGYDSFMCTLNRRWPLLSYVIVNGAMLNVADPERYSLCGPDGSACRQMARHVWQEIQDAAEEAYDRSDRCAFTSFVGYEWSGAPDSNMIHRNVIFRNHVVQDAPTSYVEVATGEGLWERLYAECLDLSNGCDAIAIPHNSNLSGGSLFRIEDEDGNPIDAETARRRARLERLVEVIQHKGSSECRGEASFGEDELCDFERLPFARMDEYPFESWWTEPPARVYAREVLATGLSEQDRLGINPFKLGLIASTDTHLGTPGLVAEDAFPGHAAGGDTTRTEVPTVPDRLFFNPGGLAVIWAEENSRDALFEGMRRREVYGTSGPRMVVRFFGGFELPSDLCERDGFARDAYAHGVPMGGDLSPPPDGSDARTPRLAVWAARDPSLPPGPEAQLQRVQIVKLWLEDGAPRERVFDVAGDRDNGAGVDPATCTPHGPRVSELCAVFTDPDFDPAAPALYYARVLENPSCRWSSHVCVAQGARCEGPGALPSELAYCCDAAIPKTIQERAWTSPIWYTPTSPAARAPRPGPAAAPASAE